MRVLVLALSCFFSVAWGEEAVISSDGVKFMPDPTVAPVAPKPRKKKKPSVKKVKKAIPPPPSPSPEPSPISTSTPTPSPTPTPVPSPPPAPTPKPVPIEKPAPLPTARTPAVIAPRLSVISAEKKEIRKDLNLSLGGHFGASYSFPGVGVEYALTSSFAIGLEVNAYSNFSSSNLRSVLGALVTGNVFPGTIFEGFFVQAGIGAYSLNGKLNGVPEAATRMVGMGTLNWRIPLTGGWSLRAGAGAYYAFGSPLSTIRFSGLLPLGIVDLGYSF